MASKTVRRYEEENRQFNEKWTNDFLMAPLPSNKGMVCLVCSDVLKIIKRTNAKAHYQAKHAATYDPMTDVTRKQRVASLSEQHRKQQAMMRGPADINQKSVLASYKIAYLLSRAGMFDGFLVLFLVMMCVAKYKFLERMHGYIVS